MFRLFGICRRWVNKYNDVDTSALSPNLRISLLLFRIMQPVVVMAGFGWTLYLNVLMMYLSFAALGVWVVMQKIWGPMLDRALAVNSAVGGSKLEKLQARYLNLPEGDPGLDAALREYLEELAKTKKP
jgi:hypothetical protein